MVVMRPPSEGRGINELSAFVLEAPGAQPISTDGLPHTILIRLSYRAQPPFPDSLPLNKEVYDKKVLLKHKPPSQGQNSVLETSPRAVLQAFSSSLSLRALPSAAPCSRIAIVASVNTRGCFKHFWSRSIPNHVNDHDQLWPNRLP